MYKTVYGYLLRKITDRLILLRKTAKENKGEWEENVLCNMSTER